MISESFFEFFTNFSHSLKSFPNPCNSSEIIFIKCSQLVLNLTFTFEWVTATISTYFTLCRLSRHERGEIKMLSVAAYMYLRTKF